MRGSCWRGPLGPSTTGPAMPFICHVISVFDNENLKEERSTDRTTSVDGALLLR
jgi:hypothetical protein